MNVRAEFAAHLWSSVVFGFKGFKYLFSKNYRVRLQKYWIQYPQRRSGNITQMTLGAVLIALIVLSTIVGAMLG